MRLVAAARRSGLGLLGRSFLLSLDATAVTQMIRFLDYSGAERLLECLLLQGTVDEIFVGKVILRVVVILIFINLDILVSKLIDGGLIW